MDKNFFQILYQRYRWRPIPGCPGRYLLRGGLHPIPVEEFVGKEFPVFEENFANTPDPVSYCFFPGGGMISYRKPTGYIHTLCETEGMKRKMALLKNGKMET